MIPLSLLALVLFAIIASWAYHDAILTTGSVRSAKLELAIITIGALLVIVPFALFFSGMLAH